MTKLSDTQSILLSTASQRDDHNLRPLPTSLTAGGGVSKAIAALIKAGFAEQRDANVFATVAGLAAIGIEPEGAGETAPPAAAEPPITEPALAKPRETKSAVVIALLAREQGVTLAELIAVTGWLPHTTRAALTGLRKKGHAIERCKRDDITCYRIVAAA